MEASGKCFFRGSTQKLWSRAGQGCTFCRQPSFVFCNSFLHAPDVESIKWLWKVAEALHFRRRNWQNCSLSWNRNFRMRQVLKRCWDTVSSDNSSRREPRGNSLVNYSLPSLEVPTFQGCQYQELTIRDSSYGVRTVRTYERSFCAVNSSTGIMERFRAQMIGLWVGQTSIAKLLHCWTLVFLWFYCGIIKYATFFISKEPTVERLWMVKVACVFEL